MEDIANIQRELLTLKSSVDIIRDAIVGNDITKDKGLLGRLERLETKVRFLEEQVKEFDLSRAKNSVYISQLAYVSGAIAIAFIGFIVNQILNR